MKALRIVLTQTKAHYRKEETIDNKMTYPLPPFSTVIGAIHRSCNFSEYHPMDLCIQGTYSSLTKQAYTDHCFLDSVMDDRGILVKMKNSNLLNSSFEKVAVAKKPTGSSFKKQTNIGIINHDIFNDYLNLRNLNDDISNFKKIRLDKFLSVIKQRKKTLNEKKKKTDKKLELYTKINDRETQIKNLENEAIYKFKAFEKINYSDKISEYQSLTTSLKYYEVLHNVKLVIHVRSEEDNLLETIKDNIYNLKSIGRSEDFVNIEECEIINLKRIEDEDEITSSIPAYVNILYIKNREITPNKIKEGIAAKGTKYYLGKIYNNDNGFRDFKEKIKAVYISNYNADEDSTNIFLDEIENHNNGVKNYLVNFS